MFRLCLKPGLDEEKLKEHGYHSYLEYVMGLDKNISSVGWGGHVKDHKLNPGQYLIKGAIVNKLNFSIFFRITYCSTHNSKTFGLIGKFLTSLQL